MRAYSQDLRERGIAAWQEGHPQGWIAQTYRVSEGTVKRYIKRYRETGKVEATEQKRMQPRIGKADEAALREMVRQHPQARLDEYCGHWVGLTGVVVSDKTMSRILVRFGLRRKKRA